MYSKIKINFLGVVKLESVMIKMTTLHNNKNLKIKKNNFLQISMMMIQKTIQKLGTPTEFQMRLNLIIHLFLMFKLLKLIYCVNKIKHKKCAVIKINITLMLNIMKNSRKMKNFKHFKNNVISLKNFANVLILNDIFFIKLFLNLKLIHSLHSIINFYEL